MALHNAFTDCANALVTDIVAKLLDAGVKDSEGNDYDEDGLTSLLGLVLFVHADEEEDKPAKPKKQAKKPPAKAATGKGKGKKDAEEVDYSSLDEFTLMLNYGPKSHALFGETKEIKPKLMEYNKTYKEETGDKKNLFSYNGKLKVDGEDTPGWTITDKDKLDDVKAFLDELGVKYNEVEKEKKGKAKKETEAKKEAKKPPAKTDAKKGTAKDKDAKTDAKKDTKKDAKTDKKASDKPVLKAQKNSWDNMEEADTGYIFLELPLGVGGRKVPVVVGKQDSDAEEDVKGLASVLPLDDEEKAACDEHKWRVLSDEDMAVVEKKAKKVHAELKKMLERESAEPEEHESDAEGEDKEEGEEGEEEAEGEEAEEGEVKDDE